jgi:FkbH-like protein
LSKDEYIKSLEAELSFDVDNLGHSKRVSELANKTNQFIFTYKRYSLQETETLMSNPDSTIVTISLKDKLSDSGIIGVMALKKQNDVGQLDEFFVSCRALGRGMDDAIILGAIKLGMDRLAVKKLQISFTKGERNLPAENFVKEKLMAYISGPQPLTFEYPTHLMQIKMNTGSQHER